VSSADQSKRLVYLVPIFFSACHIDSVFSKSTFSYVEMSEGDHSLVTARLNKLLCLSTRL
jgi:hypothetical protein